MGKKSKSQKHKILLPPDLPPDVADEEIQVSDEDLQFVNENQDYAGFVSSLDTQSITKHVTRVADVKEDALETLYEKRLKKKALQKENEQTKLPDDYVDALPVKTLEGKLYYRKLTNVSEMKQSSQNEERVCENGAIDNSIAKLTKAERRAKFKKSKKELKKQGKELVKVEVTQQTPHAAILAEVEDNLTVEEAFENKKRKLAEQGSALLADPESNVKSLREMLQLIKDTNHTIVKLGLLSLLTVFKDIIPGYRIRLPTEKELEMKVSKDVKRMRFYESTLLFSYKVYLQKLMSLEKHSSFRHVAVRCVCDLVEAVPHFNFQESLLNIVVMNISSPDDIIRKLCCAAIKSLFTNDGKHGGEATVDAVRLIANQVKIHECQLHPDSIETFLSLSFDEDLKGPEKKDVDRGKNKKKKKENRFEAHSQLEEDERKKSTKDMRMRIGEEVAADYRAASFALDLMRRRQMQTDSLSAVFETYFRILKNSMLSTTIESGANPGQSAGGSGSHPLLAPCLKGLGKFSHFIDLDFLGDLLNYLRRLASSGDKSSESSKKRSNGLSISERLHCCMVAFKVVKKNLGALNIDLQDFFVQLYNLVLEYRPGRDQGEVLAEALKVMLCEDRQHDMQKAAAFVKRLASFSLCFGSEEAMAALVTLKHLLQKNVKCRNLLENDVGGGSALGSIAKYQPYASDPNLSGALASVLRELSLLSRHYHPSVSKMASSISSMNNDNNQVYVSTISPLQAYTESLFERETFNQQIDIRQGNKKRKRSNDASSSGGSHSVSYISTINEDEARKKLGDHFVLLRNIKENERLMGELKRTEISLQLYKEYQKQQKKKGQPPNVSARKLQR